MWPLRGGDKWLGLSVPIRVDLWLMIGFQPPNALVNQMLSVHRNLCAQYTSHRLVTADGGLQDNLADTEWDWELRFHLSILNVSGCLAIRVDPCQSVVANDRHRCGVH
jgi:hypothetical protein